MNLELLAFAEFLGKRYDAHVILWGCDEEGINQTDCKKQWHLWSRGANAIDLAPSTVPQYMKRRLDMMASEARDRGYQAIVNYEKGFVHIEVPW